MNETITTILSRRSIRSFLPRQISETELSDIIGCGLRAPSALNSQGWHFTVIQNSGLISTLNSDLRELLPPQSRETAIARNSGNPDFSVFHNAPTIIIISGQKDNNWTSYNCGFATENICLAAHSLGIGSCIIGLCGLLFSSVKADEYIKMLRIPEGLNPLYAISLGYPNCTNNAPELIPEKVNYIR